jgi:glycine/D-amino acid oxidase-like deaminating enzyme
MVKIGSYWLDYAYSPRSPLKKNIKTDVAIIGGGITGVSAAFHLASRGIECVLLEKSTIGSGSTGNSEGNLVPLPLGRFRELVEKVGRKNALDIYNASVSVIREMANLSKGRPDLSFHYTKKFVLATTRAQAGLLKKEFKLTKACNIKSRFIPVPHKVIGASKTFYGGLIYESNFARINPARFVRELATRSEKSVKIFENTPVKVIRRLKDGRFELSSSTHRVVCNTLIAATETFSSEIALKDKNFKSIGVVAAIAEPLDKNVLRKLKIDINTRVIDTSENYAAIGPISGNKISVTYEIRPKFLSAFRHIVEFPIIRNIAAYVVKHGLAKVFPLLEKSRIDRIWGCKYASTKDMMPIIGRDPKNSNFLYSIGYGDHGLVFGFLGGKMLSEVYTKTQSRRTKKLLSLLKPKNGRNLTLKT